MLIAEGTSVTFGHRSHPAIMRIMISRFLCVMFMATLATEWPLTAVIYGMLFGGLAVHFFWRWAPKGLPTFGAHSAALIVPRHRVQDIDTPEDWAQAELMHAALAQRR